METAYAHLRTRLLWVVAAIVGACCGAFLIVTALRLPSGVKLTGQFALQPAVKAATAVLLAVAAVTHPIARERRWLLAAVCFAVSDAMIGIGKFVLAPTNTEALAVPIWWAYAMLLLLITAGLFFARSSVPSATPSA